MSILDDIARNLRDDDAESDLATCILCGKDALEAIQVAFDEIRGFSVRGSSQWIRVRGVIAQLDERIPDGEWKIWRQWSRYPL